MNKKTCLITVVGVLLVSLVFLLRKIKGALLFYGTDSYQTIFLNNYLLVISLGILSVLLLNLLVKELEEKYWILTVYVVSPAFVGLFSSANYQIIALNLVLAGLIVRKYKTISFLLLFSSLFFLLKNVSLNLSFYSLISEFGNYYGISIFSFIFSMYGLIVYFNKRKNSTFFLLLSGVLTSVLVFNNWNAVFHLITSFFSGIALYNIFNKNWVLLELKKCSLALVIALLISSTLSHIFYLSSLPPYQSFELHLKNNISEKDIVLTTEEMSVWIEYFTNAKTIVNNKIFKVNNFSKIKKFIDENKISHIIVPVYKFERKNEGLFFLLENEEYFEKKVSHKDLMIFKVKNGK